MDEVAKPNRRAKLDKRERGSMVVYRPLGMPSWMRDKPRTRKDFEIAKVTKQARRKA